MELYYFTTNVSLKGYQASQESPKHHMCNSWHNSKTKWDLKKYLFIYFHDYDIIFCT